MPFDYIKFPEDSKFFHCLSRDFFILKRNIDRNYLTLTLYNKKKVSGHYPEAGSIKITCDLVNFLHLNPDDKKHYGVKELLILSSYRKQSIGTLLMYIATREVQLNGGTHLYLIFPIVKAFGFYIRFGFHPAPEEVLERRLLYSDEDWQTKVPIKKKINASRSFILWRSSVDIASDLLMKRLIGVFIFKHMI